MRLPENMILPPDMQARASRTRLSPSGDGPMERHPKAPAPLGDDTDEENKESESDHVMRESDGERSSVATDTSDTSLTEWRMRTGGLAEEKATPSKM